MSVHKVKCRGVWSVCVCVCVCVCVLRVFVQGCNPASCSGATKSHGLAVSMTDAAMQNRSDGGAVHHERQDHARKIEKNGPGKWEGSEMLVVTKQQRIVVGD